MISKEEIEAQSRRMDVHVANVERDYVFGWLLKSFFENEYLSPLLAFKGGNCMRKAFYPNTRFSGDLDFSVEHAIDQQRVLAEINRACQVAQSACGVVFDLDKNTFAAEHALDGQRKSYKGRVYFKDFYGNPDHVLISARLDLTEFDRILLPTVARDLIHPYSDADICRVTLRCVSLEELIANKLKCLIQRRHSFDLYDLVYATFFDRSINVDRSAVLSTFLRKTIFEPSPGAAKEILLGLPMTIFRAAWDKYVSPIASRFDFDQAIEGFAASIESIFGSVPSWGWNPEAFYPPRYRNLILDAGAGRRLLRITYDHGHERQIEPYALAYKRRQDGHASEYLYAWDRTGGRTSGPGIKTFFHHKIGDLQLSDEQFEPRFPIELSKAGESRSKDYFGKPFSAGGGRPAGRASPRVHRQRRVTFVQSYTVECPYCQKRFKRSRAATALKPHKDTNGYPCSGRVGYFI